MHSYDMLMKYSKLLDSAAEILVGKILYLKRNESIEILRLISMEIKHIKAPN